MELRQLHAFVTLAEELHFGRAAERLDMAQSALSALVRKLEERVGVRLFFRTTRVVQLTRAGEVFLPEARATLEQSAAAVAAARRIAHEGSELVKLGGVDSATAGLLPSLLRDYRAQFPDTEFKIAEMLSATALNALDNRLLDIAFSRIASPDASHSSRLVLREPLLFAVSARHRLAELRRPRLAAVAAEPLVIPARSHRPILFDSIHHFFRGKGFEPKVLQEINERHTAIAMVAAGLGISIVPAWVARFAHPDVVFRALPGGAPMVDVWAVWRRNESMQAVTRLLECLPATTPADALIRASDQSQRSENA